MRNPKSKEVKIFCDKETGVASVRVFKFRNYAWAGGKTLELKKDSPKLKRVFDIILQHLVEPIDKSSILWKEDNESAITYVLEMKDETKTNIS